METMTTAGIRQPWFRMDYENKDVYPDLSQSLRPRTYCCAEHQQEDAH